MKLKANKSPRYNYAVSSIRVLEYSMPDAPVVPVMGGAPLAAENLYENNWEGFFRILTGMLHHAVIYEWPESLPQAMSTFCRLVMVDDALVEAYIGKKFDDIDFTPIISLYRGQ